MALHGVIITLALVFFSQWTTSSSTPELLPNSQECPIPYRNVGGRCLFFNNMGFGNWHYMREACHSIHGEMIKIDSPNFFLDLVLFLNNQSFEEETYWIGASDEMTEGVWLWADYSTVQMGTPFWGTIEYYGIIQEPNGGEKCDCAAIDKKSFYYFADYDCAEEVFSVICEYGG